MSEDFRDIDPLQDVLDLVKKYKACFTPPETYRHPSRGEFALCRVVEHPVVADLAVMYGHSDAATKVLIERLSRAEALHARPRYEAIMSCPDLWRKVKP